jgi:hemerythrin
MGAAVEWSDDFLLGIDAIDRQHQRIFELLLRLEKSITEKESWNAQRFHLADLSEFLKFHLSVEESVLEILGYEELDMHKRGHSKLTDKMLSLEQDLKNSEANDALLSFFRDWFVHHVLVEDKTYAEYVKSRSALVH